MRAPSCAKRRSERSRRCGELRVDGRSTVDCPSVDCRSTPQKSAVLRRKSAPRRSLGTARHLLKGAPRRTHTMSISTLPTLRALALTLAGALTMSGCMYAEGTDHELGKTEEAIGGDGGTDSGIGSDTASDTATATDTATGTD